MSLSVSVSINASDYRVHLDMDINPKWALNLPWPSATLDQLEMISGLFLNLLMQLLFLLVPENFLTHFYCSSSNVYKHHDSDQAVTKDEQRTTVNASHIHVNERDVSLILQASYPSA